MTSLDWRLVDRATADGRGQTGWDADRDDEARGELRVGGESDVHTGDVGIEDGQRLSWTGDLVDHGDGEGTGTRREAAGSSRRQGTGESDCLVAGARRSSTR